MRSRCICTFVDGLFWFFGMFHGFAVIHTGSLGVKIFLILLLLYGIICAMSWTYEKIRKFLEK